LREGQTAIIGDRGARSGASPSGHPVPKKRCRIGREPFGRATN